MVLSAVLPVSAEPCSPPQAQKVPAEAEELLWKGQEQAFLRSLLNSKQECQGLVPTASHGGADKLQQCHKSCRGWMFVVGYAALSKGVCVSGSTELRGDAWASTDAGSSMVWLVWHGLMSPGGGGESLLQDLGKAACSLDILDEGAWKSFLLLPHRLSSELKT